MNDHLLPDENVETMAHGEPPLVARRVPAEPLVYPETLGHEDSPLVAKRVRPDSSVPPAMGRYRLGAELARGGMGVVHRAVDLLFDREVAFKILAPSLIGTPAATRFLTEAKITGQLQHPGIPPVHEVGTLPDGRPFLAMKFIHGETLADRLKNRDDPESDFEKFIEDFERICQTVAFAHARGVIHRDLKPQNIMVGAFGEVQVMDWGLAKDLNSAVPSPYDLQPVTWDPNAPKADFAPDATQDGAVLGTPAFMPPEQARGEIDRLDPRTDVFSLGAVLCTILTGSPPYTGSSSAVVWRKAAAADLTDCLTRLKESRASHKLVLLCKRCLDPSMKTRPAHAGELAAAITLIRTGVEEFSRQAELDSAVAEANAAARKAERTSKLWLGLAVFAVLLALAVAGYDYSTVDARVEERLKSEGSGNKPVYVPPATAEPKPDPKPAAPKPPDPPKRTPNPNAATEADTLLMLAETWLGAPKADPLGRVFGTKKSLTYDEKRRVVEIRKQFDRLQLDLPSGTAGDGYLLLSGLFDLAGETDEADVAWASALIAYRQRTTQPTVLTVLDTTLQRINSRRVVAPADRAVLARGRKVLLESLSKKSFTEYERSKAGEVFERMARLWESVKDPAHALKDYLAAAETFQAIADDRPIDYQAQNQAAQMYIHAARLTHQAGDAAEALNLLKKARPHLEAAGKTYLSKDAYRKATRDQGVLLADIHLARGDYVAAAAACDDVVRLDYEWVRDTYLAAQVLARCLPLIAADTTLDTAEKKVLARQYADRAVKMLEKSIDRGYGDVKALKADPAFAALAENPDFRKLADDLETKLKPKK